MSNRMPMVFSVRSTTTAPPPTPAPAPAPAPAPTPRPAPVVASSRFSMYNLNKVAKKGCKSCGS